VHSMCHGTRPYSTIMLELAENPGDERSSRVFAQGSTVLDYDLISAVRVP